jgi:hypothetical protein
LLFLDTLAESLTPFGGLVHAWCLMPNHYHLAVSTPRGNLSRWFGWLQSTFTTRYNRRHRRVGHLFQGRFKAELVDAEAYARTLVGYIHFNPIRSKRSGENVFVGGMKELSEYRWSSHLDYMGLRIKPLVPWDRSWLDYWGSRPEQARRNYKDWVIKSLGQSPEDWRDCVSHGLVAGGEDLVSRVLLLLAKKQDALSGKWKRTAGKNLDNARLLAHLETEQDRDIVLWVRRRLMGERAADLAREFGYRSGSSITNTVNRVEQKAKFDKTTLKSMQKYRELSSFTD